MRWVNDRGQGAWAVSAATAEGLQRFAHITAGKGIGSIGETYRSRASKGAQGAYAVLTLEKPECTALSYPPFLPRLPSL